jgi:hypothetical protein
LAVSPIEADSTCSQAVDVRRFDLRMTIAAEVVVHVIDDDQDDIRALVGRRQASHDGGTHK